DVLNGVGNAVEGAAVAERGLAAVGELRGRVTELNGGDETVGDELAGPVVRSDDDVRATLLGALGDEVGLDVAKGLLGEVDLDAVLGLEVGRDALEVLD